MNINENEILEIELVTQRGCPACQLVEKKLNEIIEKKSNIRLVVTDLSDFIRSPRGFKLFITPAIIIKNRLWYYGDIDKKELTRRIDRFYKGNVVNN